MSEQFNMSDLVEQLNKATLAYDEGNPIMSDEEWDSLYFILQSAEQMSGIYLENSPTQKIVYEVKNSLDKVEHNHKMLSLDKTKSIDEVNDFLGDNSFIAMCKMDGLTCSLHYIDGKLVGAETRGDGEIGEDILHNAQVIKSIPKRIQVRDEMIIDGEIICDYKTFREFQAEYKNPRNFAAGSIRLLDSAECEKRHLSFIAWDVIKGFEDVDLLSLKLDFLKALGFTPVPVVQTDDNKVDDSIINMIKFAAAAHAYPIDGAVFKFDSVSYGRSLGETAHHFKNAIAYKFYDEAYPTKLKEIEWTMGRTGVLTPVAVVEPIEIDGSEIERASLHNISVMNDLLTKPYVGQTVEIYKANQIIPQILNGSTPEEGEEVNYLEVPTICPVCGGEAKIIKSESGTEQLVCINPACDGKLINMVDHFCGKKGLDIKGLSTATLGKLIEWGWLYNIIDVFSLKNHRNEWINTPGFGEKSVDNILNAIETSKNSSLEAFISALGIPLIGKTVSKELVKHFNSYEEFRQMIKDRYDFSQLDGFAESKTNALLNFSYEEADQIYQLMNIENPEIAPADGEQPLEGQTFVITGKLNTFKNRAELEEKITSLGGKVSSSVSKKTTYLINNDINSTSAKNVSANNLGIPIITEEQFMSLIDKE